MASINATTSSGIVATADNTGTLQLQTVGTNAINIDASQRAAFVAGTAALPAITTSGDTNTGMFFPAADTIAFAEGGTEAMRLDSSGRVTMSSQPGFNAFASATNWGWNNSVLPFDSVVTNRGGNFNTSTRTFTAPVAGLYVFVIRGTPSGSFGSFNWILQVNGSNSRYIGATSGLPSANQALVGTNVIYLNANDAIRVYGTGSHTGMISGALDNEFSGYLLG